MDIIKIGASLVGIGDDYASGFFVRPDRIFTAGHCLRDRSKTIPIHLRNGKTIEGTIEMIREDYDLGVVSVKADAHSQPTLSLNKTFMFPEECRKSEFSILKLRSERNHNGHPFEHETGQGVAFSSFEIKKNDSAFTRRFFGYLEIKPSVRTNGWSGSPVVLGNEVHGLIVAGNEETTHAIPSSVLRRFTREA